ncbi:type II secretion system inner membrane protein GspF [Hyphomonas sp. FCG-A18]|uniref:type II secretion system inner membrane protein GspF n=1 Tax=Hyphomonas sp. FCG-A18 TaxID=3080019 RepID=UPI002B2C679E|nr:type II secretion system inner membrane protein GspF [Hyphomonas sp. FCG-A18]
MAVFDYVAIGPDGKQATGVITADSARAARKELRLRQMSPLEVNETSEKKSQKRFSRSGGSMGGNDLVLTTRQLAMLIRSGSTVEEAVGAIAGQAEKPGVRGALMSVRAAVQEGYALDEALAQQSKVFPQYYRSVVSAGLQAGRLGEVLERLATHLEKSRKLRRKLLSALIYPAVLAVVALVVVILLMVFVVPAVVEQFDTIGQDLPPLTEGVIAVSNFLRGSGIILIPLLMLAGWGMRRVFTQPALKLRWDKFVLALPLIGKLMRTVNAARFSRTFATLSGSGATVPDALVAARGAVGNAVFQKALTTVRRDVEEGQSLNRALRKSELFPGMLVHMVASGERGGNLPDMMGRAADYMEDELDNNATVALGLVEPLLIVILAGIVALIVLAIMLPILQLNTMAIGG